MQKLWRVSSFGSTFLNIHFVSGVFSADWTWLDQRRTQQLSFLCIPNPNHNFFFVAQTRETDESSLMAKCRRLHKWCGLSFFPFEGKKTQAGKHHRRKPQLSRRRQLMIARVFGLQIPGLETMTFCTTYGGVELYQTVVTYSSNYVDICGKSRDHGAERPYANAKITAAPGVFVFVDFEIWYPTNAPIRMNAACLTGTQYC